MSKLVKISDKTYLKLDHMTYNTGLSRQDIINKAIRSLEREIIFKKANEAYAAIKINPKQWQKEQKELALWDSTLKDGLTDL